MFEEKDQYAVALGASAGGLQSLIAFFKSVPTDLPAAYIVIMHLARDRSSYLAEILANHTTLPVYKIENNQALQPGNVYVIPEGTYLRIQDSFLETFDRPHTPTNSAIDVFMESLATDKGSKAIAIVFSGYGTDGVNGALAISAAGGKVLVEEPQEAIEKSMPQAVISLDHPDYVGPAAELALHLRSLIIRDFTA